MYVECFTNNGKPYLRLVRNDRVTNKKGMKVSTKTVVLNIGPLDRFDDGLPDYVGRLKKSFKAGQPLIPLLLPYCDSTPPAETYQFSIKTGSPDCFGHPRLFSHVLLERILEELGLNTFFSSYKSFTKLQYDVYGFAKLLFFGRLLNPSSKSATVRQNEDYYESVLGPHNLDNVFDTLDFLSITSVSLSMPFEYLYKQAAAYCHHKKIYPPSPAPNKYHFSTPAYPSRSWAAALYTVLP